MENPILSEAALASLTSKINSKIKKNSLVHNREAGEAQKSTHRKKSSKKPPHEVSGTRAPNGDGYITKQSGKNTTKKKVPSGEAGLPVEQSISYPSETLSKSFTQPGEKKRLRNGKIKRKSAVLTSDKGGTHEENLRQAVFDLGGEEEDLALVENAASESELEGTSVKLDQAFNKELQEMVRKVGKAGRGELELTDSEEEPPPPETKRQIPHYSEPNKRPRQANSVNGRDARLSFEPRPDWHGAELPIISNAIQDAQTHSSDELERLQAHARKLLETENEIYTSKHLESSSAHQFYSVVMTSGTLSDKISALTLSVQESPLHAVRALENLVALAKKRSRAQAIEVLTALKDLFGPGNLLPSERHLRSFIAQPGLNAISGKQLRSWTPGQPLPNPLRDVHLICWAYEDWLKHIYFETLKILETWCNDEIVFARTKAVDMVYELLREKPEQESNLLRMLVNKLGDSEKKIASRASYNILQLQIPHRLMKPHIIAAIEADILFRPGQSLHAKYYAVLTLNQTVLSTREGAVAKQLMELHFNFFLTLLAKPDVHKQESKAISVNKKDEIQGGGGKPGKKALKKSDSTQKGNSVEDEMREKTLSAVLTGINRAIPFTDTNDEFFERHMDSLFRITHSFNLNTSLQALMLLQQLSVSHQGVSDRFYRTLYESLLDPRLLTSSKHILYLDLLFRALRNDLDLKRVKAFAKRLLQVASLHQPPFACGILYLLRELEKVFPSLSMFIDQPEEKLEDEEEVFYDVSNDFSDDRRQESIRQGQKESFYDGRKRAPQHSNADKSCLWELDVFTHHFHPAVRKFAASLISHEPMPPKPDLEALTRAHFLNSFVNQNPKKHPKQFRGSSIMQPLAARESSRNFFSNSIAGMRTQMLAPGEYAKLPAEAVDSTSAFLHTFYKLKAQGKEVGQRKKDKRSKLNSKEENGDSEDDDDEEQEIWKALVGSKPEIEGSESEVDFEMDDFSDISVSDTEEIYKTRTEDLGSPGLELEDAEDIWASDSSSGAELDAAFEREAEAASGKQETGRGRRKERKEHRKKLRSLPTYASLDQYAKLLGEDDDEDV